jgi:hypothetical protein
MSGNRIPQEALFPESGRGIVLGVEDGRWHSGVPLSKREQLVRLLSQVQRLSDEHWHMLRRPQQAMDGQAWVGPSGRAFGRALARNDQTLQARLRESVELVRDKLRHVH